MGNTTFLLGGETPLFQDDLACVLQLAEDELTHLKRDAEIDAASANDYLDSKNSFDRVRRFFEVIYAGG